MLDELWSARDAERQRHLIQAVAADALLEALLAIEGVDEAVADDVRKRVADAATEVRTRRAAGASALEAVRSVIIDTLGVTGDAVDYYRPENSFIGQVLTQQRGMPILVSSLWRLVGRAAGVDVEGVGLPGHFIARVDGQLVDPFRDGAALSPDDCRTLVASVAPQRPWSDAWLDAAPTAAIVERVLRNLVNSYLRSGDRTALYRACRLLSSLAPDDPAVVLHMAQLSEEFGAYREASEHYRRLTTAFDGTRQAQIAAIRLVEISSRTRTLN